MMSYTFLSDAIGRQSPFKELEEIRVNIGSFKMKAEVVPQEKLRKSSRKSDGKNKNMVMVILEAPICARVGDKIGICRQNKKKEWAFVGGGIIRKTKNIYIASDQKRLKEMTKDTQSTTANVSSSPCSFLKSLDEQAILALFIANQSFVNDTINPWKKKIVSYFKDGKITGERLLEIGRKQFAENLVIYAGENKIRGAASKTFDRFCKLNMDKDVKATEQKEETKNDNEDQNGKVKRSHQKMMVGIGRRDDENLNENKQSIHIAYQQRNGKKGITTIVGLPSEINFKKLVKKMKKQLHSNATLVEDVEKGTVVQMQGDKRKELQEYIVSLHIGVEKDETELV